MEGRDVLEVVLVEMGTNDGNEGENETERKDVKNEGVGGHKHPVEVEDSVERVWGCVLVDEDAEVGFKDSG